MARKSPKAPVPPKSSTIKEATADGAASAIGFALDAINSKSSTGNVAKAVNLAALCDQAADHMALAHNLLVTHEVHTDTAIDHLDAALDCLKKLVVEGEKRTSDEDAAPEERSA